MSEDKRPTVADVALKAGVSLGTVSNVLNGVIPVSEKTRERVLNAIAELDYRQNMLAQGLRSKRAPIVGVCVPHINIAYFSELADTFEEVASNNNIEIMQVLSRNDPEKEYNRVKSLLNYQVGGLFLVPTIKAERTYELIAQSGIPTVIVDRVPSGVFNFDRVSFDNHAAMRQAGEGLIQRGHRNILFIVHQRTLNVTVQRIAGLKVAADACAEKVTTNVIECDTQSALIAKLAAEMRRQSRPTAIIVSNSTLAAWIFRAFRMLQLKCPEDVSLIAFDEPQWADIVTPTLSVVRQPTRDIAIMAWRFLLHRIANETEETQAIQLEAEIVFRNSVRDLRSRTP